MLGDGDGDGDGSLVGILLLYQDLVSNCSAVPVT